MELGQRAPEYLIHTRGQPDLSLMGNSPAFAPIGGLRDVRHVSTIRSSALSLQSAGPNASHTTVVVQPTTQASEQDLLARVAQSGPIIVARNHYLAYAGPSGPRLALQDGAPRALVPVTVRLRIQDVGGWPVPNVLVKTFFSNAAQGLTDANGQVTLSFLSGTTICDAIYIKPQSGLWEQWIPNPDLQDGVTVTLQTLDSWPAAEFSIAQPYATWAQKMLGLDVTNPALNGLGIKVAVADSGCDITHPLATRFRRGMNYTSADPTAWGSDTIGHGTWCETLIAGYDMNTVRRGFAPSSDMHTMRILPGGTLASLQRALTYCVDQDIDVLSLSLGTPTPDAGTSAFLQEAIQAGVAIIVAAGNSYGPVAFPASEPGACAVSALGQAGRFPPNTYHAQTQANQTLPGAVGTNGYFAPDFTASGPQIRVCAPGVAVISGAPGGGYSAEDGTSMACPAVAGMATLLLAHHPALKDQPRSQARTETLYSIMMRSALSIGLAPSFAGSGLANLGGTQPQPAAASMTLQQPTLEELLRGLIAQSSNRDASGASSAHAFG